MFVDDDGLITSDPPPLAADDDDNNYDDDDDGDNNDLLVSYINCSYCCVVCFTGSSGSVHGNERHETRILARTSSLILSLYITVVECYGLHPTSLSSCRLFVIVM